MFTTMKTFSIKNLTLKILQVSKEGMNFDSVNATRILIADGVVTEKAKTPIDPTRIDN